LILVTGANGFVGQAICKEFAIRGQPFRGVVRKLEASNNPKFFSNFYQIGNFNGLTEWSSVLTGIDCIIHSAFPQFIETKMRIDEYRNLNLDTIRQLTKQAVMMGVKRFIFISSIKVNGEKTIFKQEGHLCNDDLKSKFISTSVPAPTNPYAISKWEVERELWKISAKTGLEVVVVRPPLVYGPFVKGNFMRLLRLVNSGFPLPFGSINNKRSFIGLDNLIDILIQCVHVPSVTGQTLLVSDGDDLSTPELVGIMGLALGKSPRLFPFPVHLLRSAGKLAGKNEEMSRLLDSLQINSEPSFQLLNWKPKYSITQGIQNIVESK